MPPRKKTEAPEAEVTETEQAPETEAPEAEVTEGGPVDLPGATPVKPTPQVRAPRVYGKTFAERKAAREGKQVTGAQAENKAVQK